MTAERLIPILKHNGMEEGFSALLADSSNTALVRKIRSRAPGMEVFVRIQTEGEKSTALFFTGGECESCATGEGRYEPTGEIRDIAVGDMGMALLLKDEEHRYILNLEKAIILP